MEISREMLHAYLDDALTEAESAKLEHALRASEDLRARVRTALQERDRGEHSLGAVWRRERLTCPPRDQLGSYLLETLDPDHQSYVAFHLTTVACPFCLANLADLQAQHEEATPAKARRRRFYESSAGLLRPR